VEGTEPWVTDGTPAGTYRLDDISPGAGSSVSFAPGMSEMNGYIFFPADDGTTGYELWAVDAGTTAAGVPAMGTLGSVAMAALLAISALRVLSGSGRSGRR
jgi:ELWxxDGT repeat protein